MLAVWSVGSIQWVAPTPGLYLLALWGVVLGLLLAKMRFNAWLLAVGGLLIGIYLSFYQLTSLVEGATTLDRHAEVANRLFMWAGAFVNGNAISDTLPLSCLLLFSSWVVGFICSWSFFRRHNIWGAVLPSGIIMVVNFANFLSGAQRLLLYPYLFVVCLLVARLFVLEREHDWEHRSVQRFPPDSRLLPNALRFALVVVVVTCLLPSTSAKLAPVAAVWETINSPVKVIGEEFGRSVGGLPSTETDSGHSFGPTQPFTGSTTMGEESVLTVEAPFPVYLRARSYDVYTHEGWETSATQMVSAESATIQPLDGESQKLQEVEVSVTPHFSLAAGEPMYLGGHPIDMSIEYQLEVPQPASYRISLAGGEADLAAQAENLPLDLREAVWQLWEMKSASHYTITASDIMAALPEDIRVVVVVLESGTEGVETFTVERRIPVAANMLSVRSVGALSAGDSYRATVSVSTATESDLSAADTTYPGWVLERYLQLPTNMPSQVIDLAQALTEEVETPYEKAVAIRDYLRTLEYALDIEAPPNGADGVDYFLFEQEKGYCQYFASAMAVLLRASGIPSRMVSGYGPGEQQYDPGDIMGRGPGAWQDLQQTFIVRNSHSWTEVFFPEYGWIPFEPTPVRPIIARGEFVFPPQGGEGDSDSTVEPDGGETRNPWNARLLGVPLGLALFVVVVWLGWRRLLGQVSDPRVAYARIGYLAALGGIGPRESLTPQEFGRGLATLVPEMSVPLGKIVHAYMRVFYSKHDLNSEDRSVIATAWPQVRNHLLRRALRRAFPFRFHSKRSKS